MSTTLLQDLVTMHEAGQCALDLVHANGLGAAAMGFIYGFGGFVWLDESSKRPFGAKLNGWIRAWLFGAAIWAALMGLLAQMSYGATMVMWALWTSIPALIALMLGWGVAWVRRGFHPKPV